MGVGLHKSSGVSGKPADRTSLRRTCIHARKDMQHKPAETGAGTKAASERVTETEGEGADTGHRRSLRATCLRCEFLHKQL